MTEFLPGPNGYPTNGLRDDGRQWLIYGEPQQGALVRGVEAAALAMTLAKIYQLYIKKDHHVRRLRSGLPTLLFLALAGVTVAALIPALRISIQDPAISMRE